MGESCVDIQSPGRCPGPDELSRLNPALQFADRDLHHLYRYGLDDARFGLWEESPAGVLDFGTPYYLEEAWRIMLGGIPGPMGDDEHMIDRADPSGSPRTPCEEN